MPLSRGSDASTRRLLTLPEAAEVLHVSGASLRRLIAQGRLPIVRLTRRVLIDVKDLEHLVDSPKERMGW
jgi:excisionase family DNA binding protein